jgi:thiol-disulfide isomerase/thioredoxin
MRNLKFKERLYCLVAALLFSFAVCGNNLYAVNEMGSGEIPAAVPDSQQSTQESKVGTKVPEFTIKSFAGEDVTQADLENWFVVLNFWSSSSQASLNLNAEIAKLGEQYKNADLLFVNISLNENRAAWEAAISGLPGLQVSELKKLEDANITKLFGVNAIPTIILLKPDGTITSIDSGNVDLAQKLKDLLGF